MAKKQRKIGKDARTEGGGSDMTKFYVILGAVAVLGVGAVGYSVGSGAMGTAVAEPVEMEEVESDGRVMEMARGMTKGDENAPITIIEFGDYQCPGCGVFASVHKPQVEAAFVETGEAKFVFYDFPLVSIHPNAFIAARAARCGGDQDRFWDYHDMLFSQQRDWSGAADPVGRFVEYAETLGMDADQFEECINSDAHAATVTAGMRLGEMLAVNGTPAIIVGQAQGMPRRLQSYSFQSIEAAVRELQAIENGG